MEYPFIIVTKDKRFKTYLFNLKWKTWAKTIELAKAKVLKHLDVNERVIVDAYLETGYTKDKIILWEQ
jgi:hypothetical protein